MLMLCSAAPKSSGFGVTVMPGDAGLFPNSFGLLRFRFLLFEFHPFVALMAQRGIGLMPVMAVRALDIAGFGQMVLVRVSFIVFGSLGHRLQRCVASETGLFRSGSLRLCLSVAACALHAPFFMAIRRNGACLLGDSYPSPEKSDYGGQTEYASNHVSNPFLPRSVFALQQFPSLRCT